MSCPQIQSSCIHTEKGEKSFLGQKALHNFILPIVIQLNNSRRRTFYLRPIPLSGLMMLFLVYLITTDFTTVLTLVFRKSLGNSVYLILRDESICLIRWIHCENCAWWIWWKWQCRPRIGSWNVKRATTLVERCYFMLLTEIYKIQIWSLQIFYYLCYSMLFLFYRTTIE